MSVAFVFSGGSSHGAIHVGMLRALYERDIFPDLIVGTSVGALNGAFVSSRPKTVETIGSLGNIWRSMTRSEIFPLKPLTGLAGFIGRRTHLFPGHALRRLVRRQLEFSQLESAAIPLHVIATDLHTGDDVRL